MKIALVILDSDKARGGAERYTVDLAHALAGAGHDTTLISAALSPKEETTDTTSQPFAQVKLRGGGLTRTRRYRRFIDSVDAHLLATPYDIVHAMLPIRRADLYHPHAGVATQVGRKANAIFNPRRKAMAEVEEELLDDGDVPPTVLCLSQYVERHLKHYYPNASTATLFNAVDLQKFDPAIRPDAGAAIRQKYAIAEGDVVALIIAQDFARKGVRQAIEAVAATADKRLRLLVVGDGAVRRYARLASKLGVADRVTFTGRTDDAYAFYQAADFFVLPTRHDPCSLVVLEALAMGLPVISTTSNGATEIMNGTHGCVLSDPGDVAALVRAIEVVLDNDSRQHMAAACLTLRPQLAYEAHLAALLAIYESRLAAKALSGPASGTPGEVG
ncbi:MAG TPA: glycosyltransferase family 4 protein [Tepidisphaeraceae bacterium]|jgi:UDP-glucose:(heptosyl)LPS alpha-1,3-glucosyltransferase|nr:glycosyltransferase family 4 protein [Tepidisphaeraceae bacterium]